MAGSNVGGSADGETDAPQHQLDKNYLTTAFFNSGKAVVAIDYDPDQATIVCFPVPICTTPARDAMFAWQGQWRNDGGMAMHLVHSFIHELAHRLADNFARNCCCRPWFKLWTQESRVCPPDLIDTSGDDDFLRRLPAQRSMRNDEQFLRRHSFQVAMRNDEQFRRMQMIFRCRR